MAGELNAVTETQANIMTFLIRSQPCVFIFVGAVAGLISSFRCLRPSPLLRASKRMKAVSLSHTKEVSRRKRRTRAVPVLGAAGLSFSLVAGASAAIGGMNADPAASAPVAEQVMA